MVEPKIRFAVPEDAAELAQIVDLQGMEVDWANSTSGWLVAEDEAAAVLGAVCLYLGRPVGFAEMLSIRSDLNPRDAHAVMVALTNVAKAALEADGSTITASFVPFDKKGWKRTMKKRFNMRVTGSGNMLTDFNGAV